MRATLTELNNNANALARAAQAGQTVVITDRGTPIADIVPHHEQAWVTKAQLTDTLSLLQATLQNPRTTSNVVREEMDAVVDPYLDIEAAR
ncbi:MAG TPA: type II toxin-antitoxin system prevent-host-death family antitoxin [Ilumatobacteraceae bacterium]|nr:type II toxin-antitoxin system prevent-host-death family antitoxin [Ilumatobacteraceae bacterium]